MRCRHGGETEFGGRNNEPFVYKDLCTFRMINGHKRHVVVIIDFPELCSNADIVKAVMRHKLIAPNLVPFSSGCYFRGAERINAQANRGSPGRRILQELHPFAVVREE